MTKIEVDNEQEIIQEAESLLLKKLGPAQATRFWVAFSQGEGDYLETKKELFEGETVKSLYPKIKGQE